MSIIPPIWYNDSRNPFYTKCRYLPPGYGNNAFSLKHKPNRKALKVTPMRIGTFDDLRVGKDLVLHEFDHDYWRECVGLEWAILCLKYSVPVYIIDNHNHAFYCWCESLKMNWVEMGATLVHVDAHDDALFPPHFDLQISDLEGVWQYTNKVLQVASFIYPAIKLGIISQRLDFTNKEHFPKPNLHHDWPEKDDDHNIILDIDLDVFRRDAREVLHTQIMRVIEHYILRSRVIVIATSPYFIDQEYAIKLSKCVGSILRSRHEGTGSCNRGVRNSDKVFNEYAS